MTTTRKKAITRRDITHPAERRQGHHTYEVPAFSTLLDGFEHDPEPLVAIAASPRDAPQPTCARAVELALPSSRAVRRAS